MTTLADIRQELLAEGQDDYVGLWEVAWILRRSKSSHTGDEIREVALEVLGPLLCEGLMEPGTLQENGGFLAWTCTPERALARIDEEWRALGQEPNIGQVCWFSNTSAGDKAAGQNET
ncbi:hypothetical protein [Thioalkalivibrio sp. XN279]|jgi:hypothetical protein|uniref:hypothetical protein n=1 Tax=Thioalkalivibrio sp. XN279 TaxID=2714953 RepID=UPI00140B20D7|nr:hypothetical protein [Thioalkalivibrio sp. XN279]NHA16183.1 hypothetical protein [Thioalkalivibrio sp. XN279]